MRCSVAGTSRMVVPVSSSTPNSAATISSGVAIHALNPSASGPPMANPMNPPACWRAAGSVGAPDHRCQSPSTGRQISVVPSTSRGRVSGCGSVRIRTTATAAMSSGSRTTAPPTSVRSTESIQAPTGRAASNQDAAAITTASASKPSASPSRRWPGSMSRARPTERAVDPAPRATTSQVARAARPPAAAAVANGDGPFLTGGLRRGGAGLLGWEVRDVRAARAGGCDLVVRAPERAAVLFAMRARLIAVVPLAPSDTGVTGDSVARTTSKRRKPLLTWRPGARRPEPRWTATSPNQGHALGQISNTVGTIIGCRR